MLTLVTPEYPEINVYAVHPGAIATEIFAEAAPPVEATETLELPAATFLWLTARNAEFLNGR
jgi:NAD(P)-dependent dehydrogenase (short-subunit alcohol dehydrogenase family)